MHPAGSSRTVAVIGVSRPKEPRAERLKAVYNGAYGVASRAPQQRNTPYLLLVTDLFVSPNRSGQRGM